MPAELRSVEVALPVLDIASFLWSFTVNGMAQRRIFFIRIIAGLFALAGVLALSKQRDWALGIGRLSVAAGLALSTCSVQTSSSAAWLMTALPLIFYATALILLGLTLIR